MLALLITILNLISYQPDTLTTDILTERNGALIVEMDVGIVTDEEKHGQILNTASDFDYISYEMLPVNKGDYVTTYCVYNPWNNYEDDILYRIDVLQDGNVYLN